MRNKAGRVPERLLDIQESIDNARNDLGALTKEQFLTDGKTQRAVIESIIVIGESANNVMRLAPELERNSPVAWQYFKDAYDMRIILAHEYFRVDVAVVWDTVKNDLPKLESSLASISITKEDCGDRAGSAAAGGTPPPIVGP
jgi:uncharacterized protein with HEPN domain